MTVRRGIRLTDRLHFRIALFVIVTIALIFGLLSVYQLWVYQEQFTRMEVAASEELGQTLTSSLEIAMLNNDLPAVQYSLDEIAKDTDIVRVFLLNRDNTIRASSAPDWIGRTFRMDDPACLSCHGQRAPRARSTTLLVDGERVLRVVAPVANKPPCHSCHGSTATHNGVLVVDRSLGPVRRAILANMKAASVVACAAVLLMMFLFRWYIKRQLINRIVHLETLARRVVDEEFGLEITLPGRDELSSLASSFNNMRESLKRSIERIDSHRSYLAHLLENLADGILIVDQDNHVAFVNGTAYEILDITHSQLRPGDALDRLSAGDGRLAPLVAVISRPGGGRSSIHEIVRLRTPAYREQHLEIHTGELMLPPLATSQRIVVIRDITARVLIERQVYQSEKLVTVGQLAAGVAHEINNPMASILTCAESLLRDRSPDASLQREYLDIIRNSARRCKIITQKLLDYSAAPTLSLSAVQMREVLEEAMGLLQFEATRKEVRINLNVPETVPLVQGSKDALIQVFVNLILNSLDAAPKGGYVELVLMAEASSVETYVHDNGSGIDEGLLSRVFDPFFTTKAAGSSSGLGLSVSQGIVKRHGGKIEFVKCDPHRTSVRVSLPLDGPTPETRP